MQRPRGRGSYDRRLYFYKAAITIGSDNASIRTWPDAYFARRWAQRTDVPPSLLRDERFQADQFVAKTWVGFRVPFDIPFFAILRSASAENFRLRGSDGAVYDIITIAELEGTRHKVIDIMAYTRTDTTVVTP